MDMVMDTATVMVMAMDMVIEKATFMAAKNMRGKRALTHPAQIAPTI